MKRRKWEDMESNCLANIFSRVGLDSLIFWVPLVCKSWHTASSNPFCWKVINLGFLCYHSSLRVPRSKFNSTRLLELAVDNSHGSALELVFPPSGERYWYIRPRVNLEHMIYYVSEKCPALKILYLPNFNDFHEKNISRLICNWKELEWLNLVKPGSSFKQIVTEINRHCPNFRGLGLGTAGCIGPYLSGETIIDHIVTTLPMLKSFTLNEYSILRHNLVALMKGCKELEDLHLVRCRFDYNDQMEGTFNIRVNPKEEKVLLFEMVIDDNVISVDDICDYPSFMLWTKNQTKILTYPMEKRKDYSMVTCIKWVLSSMKERCT